MSEEHNRHVGLPEQPERIEVLEEHGRAYPDRFGKILLKLIIGLTIALIIVQLLLHYEPSRPYISPIQQMEGVPVNEQNVNDWIGENSPSLLHHSS